MSENIIFYFSGSGNCLDIAKNIAKQLGDTEIISLRKRPNVMNRNWPEAKTVGFIFPCYGGGMPKGLLDRIRSISIAPQAYTYAVCSCAAYPGTGLAEINEIIPLDYWSVITHQCSCVWLFPHRLMLPMLSPKKAQERSEVLAAKIGASVKAREIRKVKPSKPVVNQVEGAVFSNVLIGKKAKLLSASDECIGCGVCEKICPQGNIHLSAAGKPMFSTDCIGCLACVQYCPKTAINVGSITKSRERYHNPNISANDLIQESLHIN